MREDENTKNKNKNKNWFLKWEEQLPSPDELMPLSQSLITTDLALAFNITTPPPHAQPHAPPPHQQQPLPQHHHQHPQQTNSSAEFDSPDLPGSGGPGGSDEPARTLKRPRLVWTPQLHKRFVDAVAHLGIKNAVPKTIMQLMSVDGLTRENVASHLQKYRLYLKRMQGVNSNGGGGGGGSGGNSSDDHLFASSPVPAHFLHQGRPNSDFMPPFVAATHHQMAVVGGGGAATNLHHHQQQNLNLHHHHQQHQQQQQNLQGQFRHFGQFDHHSQFMRQSQVQRIGTPVHSGMMPPSSYVEDLESNGGRKVLTLFPTGDD